LVPEKSKQGQVRQFMDTREYLLANVRKNQPANRELPAVPGFHRQPKSLVSEFERSLTYMAGEFVGRPPSDFSAYLREKFPDAKTICCAVPLCANGRGFAPYSRFLRCCDYLGKRVLQVYSPRGKAISDSVGTVQAKGTSMALDCAFESEGCSKQEQNSKENTPASIGSAGFPARKGKRPQTIRGPLHV
jgi:hypothetical protein